MPGPSVSIDGETNDVKGLVKSNTNSPKECKKSMPLQSRSAMAKRVELSIPAWVNAPVSRTRQKSRKSTLRERPSPRRVLWQQRLRFDPSLVLESEGNLDIRIEW
ncbi:hypothetical protein I7I51_00628 [Histoplasma capsulatum]|uniref:Uncharacterized protein n=1 Tax=Ajellomyces capsulatus TaxID=5037 RepID=A0A8A1MEI5_AJECA|nr:hypothetical protein I7I51_00628 [Histoplasma capsulatum]